MMQDSNGNSIWSFEHRDTASIVEGSLCSPGARWRALSQCLLTRYWQKGRLEGPGVHLYHKFSNVPLSLSFYGGVSDVTIFHPCWFLVSKSHLKIRSVRTLSVAIWNWRNEDRHSWSSNGKSRSAWPSWSARSRSARSASARSRSASGSWSWRSSWRSSGSWSGSGRRSGARRWSGARWAGQPTPFRTVQVMG